MDGMAYIRAFTTIRIPCHRDIARSGRSALKVRKDLNTFRFSFSSMSNENTETLKKLLMRYYKVVGSKFFCVCCFGQFLFSNLFFCLPHASLKHLSAQSLIVCGFFNSHACEINNIRGKCRKNDDLKAFYEIFHRNRSNFCNKKLKSTHKNYNKVQYGPKTRKIFGKAVCEPLE